MNKMKPVPYRKRRRYLRRCRDSRATWRITQNDKAAAPGLRRNQLPVPMYTTRNGDRFRRLQNHCSISRVESGSDTKDELKGYQRPRTIRFPIGKPLPAAGEKLVKEAFSRMKRLL